VDRKPKIKRVDRHQNSLKIGDFIKVVGIPPDVNLHPDEEELKTTLVFQRCLGQLFPIHDFDEDRVELLVGEVIQRPSYEHSIWLEPKFVEFVATKKESKRKSKGRKHVVK
jgi:hypothetical protein